MERAMLCFAAGDFFKTTGGLNAEIIEKVHLFVNLTMSSKHL
jgi:hypothetical protein